MYGRTTISKLALALTIGGLLPRADGNTPPPAGRRLQNTCACQTCIDGGHTVEECVSFGSDCSCLCKCQACIDSGETVSACQSFGLDCTDCGGGGGKGGDKCSPGTCADDPTWVSSFHAHCTDYAPGGLSAGHCATGSGAGKTGGTLLATTACPITCDTCPPTFVERQTAVNDECCNEAAENCGPDHLPIGT